MSSGIARLNSNGTLDKTFDGDGKKTVGWSTLDGATAYAVAIQSDGKIVIAGDGEFASILNGINYDFAVARLNTNGSMDTSFDGDGKRSVGLGDYEHCLGVGIDTSGRIVVAGDSGSNNFAPNPSGFAAVRFNASGALDARFDSDGKARYFLDKPMIASVMLMQGDKVVITGTYGGKDLIMARIGADGKLDSTFGGSGIGWKVTDLGGTDVSRGAMKAFNGGILVSASSSSKTAFVKYTPDGALDTAFGVGGVARPSIPFNTASGVTGAGRISPFGDRIIMAGGDGTFRTSRFLDVNSNVVSVGTFNSVATETGSSQRAFIVTRTNRLPYATNVYFDLGGTAKAPLFNLPRRRDRRRLRHHGCGRARRHRAEALLRHHPGQPDVRGRDAEHSRRHFGRADRNDQCHPRARRGVRYRHPEHQLYDSGQRRRDADHDAARHGRRGLLKAVRVPTPISAAPRSFR